MPYRNLRVDFHQLLWTGTVFSVMFESSVPRPEASKVRYTRPFHASRKKILALILIFLTCFAFALCIALWSRSNSVGTYVCDLQGNIYTNKGVCNKILITNIGVHQNNQCSKQSMACRVSINTGFGQLQLSTWPPEGSASQRSTQAPVPLIISPSWRRLCWSPCHSLPLFSGWPAAYPGLPLSYPCCVFHG